MAISAGASHYFAGWREATAKGLRECSLFSLSRGARLEKVAIAGAFNEALAIRIFAMKLTEPFVGFLVVVELV